MVCGDSLEVLRTIPSCSIDALVCDPPSGIAFMNVKWDKDKGGTKQWIAWLAAILAEALRVSKPGAHALIWALPRTSHWTGMAVEESGWEVRDQLSHIFYSGFPKSLDAAKAIDAHLGVALKEVGERKKDRREDGSTYALGHSGVMTVGGQSPEAKPWVGYGTGLKPAHEVWWLARKPLDGTVAENLLKHGTGVLNIDGCRIKPGDLSWPGPSMELEARFVPASDARGTVYKGQLDGSFKQDWYYDPKGGRWPANIYYSPKPSTSEREWGCDELAQASAGELTGGREEDSKGLNSPRSGAGRTSGGRGNVHPTVKGIGLMKWLCRLVTPSRGLILDPFIGSGSTLLAAESEGFRCIGIDLDPRHCEIVAARYQGIAGPWGLIQT